MGHAKLRGRVRRVLRRRRRGSMKPVRCQRGCYVIKQHCLRRVRACENVSSRLDARSVVCVHTFLGLSMSVCLQNCTENQVSTVTDYVTHC